MASSITCIPATRNVFTAIPMTSITKRRVAAYARVSTDSDEQFTSYEAQIDYYTKFIRQHEDWTYISVYTDEGISGTNTKKREGFNQMVSDALSGKIDLIVTKSVSRFARNTVDSLVTVRKLKEHGVEIFFEKENIWTLDSKGELLITIMSSLAQEESRSISENVTWGQRKRFSDGKVSMPYKHFLGYEKGENGQPVVKEKEAVIVRRIFRLFLEGKTPAGICRHLEANGIPTPSGKQKWSQTTVNSILRNEKYKGDALLQKRFTVDFLTKRMKANTGEVPQFYVEGSHEGIIAPNEFDLVQAEIERRKGIGGHYSGSSVFSSKLVCADCGAFFGQKVWHSTDKYRKVIWRCNAKFNGEHKCATPHLTEDEIKAAFLKAYNRLMGNREQVVSDCRLMLDMLSDHSKLDAQIAKANEEIKLVAGLVSACVHENAEKAQDQDAFNKHYNSLVDRHQKAIERLEKLKAACLDRVNRARELQGYIDKLSTSPLVLDSWDDKLWRLLVVKGVVGRDGSIEFEFFGGRNLLILDRTV
ncbi:MAG: recombinase family protein [Eubacteriales bacterium]|nr:recombinase family protein [Eubacteriales bacterium]